MALELQRRHPASSITLLEKEPSAGRHASGRNSGVLHSGIYYPADTLKAKMCKAGSQAMQAFAAEHQITCHRSGKIIVAASEADRRALDILMGNAAASGIRAERLDAAGIRRLEPFAENSYGGLVSPDTCVIESPAVVRRCVELFEQRGGRVVYGAAIINADPLKNTLFAADGRSFTYSYLVNCAGAYADVVAHWFGLAADYVLVPFKGVYFKLAPQRDELVRSSIYPVPNLELPFLGVHFTRVASGSVYVGPTAIPALGRENYGILSGVSLKESFPIVSQLIGLYRRNQNNMRNLVNLEVRKYLKPYFVGAARKLIPSLRSNDLISCDKVGIRPQLVNVRLRKLEMDYILEQTPNSMHVLNAISPAFTSSFAFANYIVNKI